MLAHAVPVARQFDPVQLVPVALATLLYFRRVRTLHADGVAVPTWKLVSFGTGIFLLLVALASPVDEYADHRLFSIHMLQHLLLGDLAPVALLAGLNGPILRPILRYLHRLRVLAHPLVALPLWAVDLYAWHLPFLYQAALHHDAVHAFEHACFFTGGALMWMPVLETLPAPEWFGTGAKLGYIVVVRLITTVLANVFIWSGTVFYPYYTIGEARIGISPLHDQAFGGVIMMLEGSFVTLAAIAWLFLRLAAEGELRQELLERGLDPRAVKRAVRYGRGAELADQR